MLAKYLSVIEFPSELPQAAYNAVQGPPSRAEKAAAQQPGLPSAPSAPVGPPKPAEKEVDEFEELQRRFEALKRR